MKVAYSRGIAQSCCYIGTMKSKPNLDMLRSIAVLLVVVEHILLAMRIHWIGSWNIAWIGVVGVFMFLCIPAWC